MFERLKRYMRHKKRLQIIRMLKETESHRIVRYGESLIVSATKRTAKLVPAYRQILSQHNVDINKINTVDDFKKHIPILDKEKVFGKFDIEQLCTHGNLDGFKWAMTSSGYSGVFSYSISVEGDEKRIAESLDVALNYVFDAENKKPFIINALPMGVKGYSAYPISHTSVRSDMVLSLVKCFGNKFPQTIIVADPHFAKKIVEEGVECGIKWKEINMSFVLGEDWFSNSLREYISKLAGIELANPGRGQVCSTMGVTELDLNIFHDSIHTVRIRDAASKDEKLRKALFGNLKYSPEVMYYYPHRTFIETINCDKDGFGEMTTTILSESIKNPLIRYNTRDLGKIIHFHELKQILDASGYSHLVPEFKLPIIALKGSHGNYIETKDGVITPEEIKEALYQNHGIAGSVTGYFRLIKPKDKAILEIQLKEKATNDQNIQNLIKKTISNFLQTPVEINVYEYAKFPYGMTLDYERKFKCV